MASSPNKRHLSLIAAVGKASGREVRFVVPLEGRNSFFLFTCSQDFIRCDNMQEDGLDLLCSSQST